MACVVARGRFVSGVPPDTGYFFLTKIGLHVYRPMYIRVGLRIAKTKVNNNIPNLRPSIIINVY